MKLPLVLVFAFITTIACEFTSAADSPTPPFEEVPAVWGQWSKDFAAKVERTSKLVDTEAAAGRVTGPTAQLLQWNLKTLLTESGRQKARSILYSSGTPSENATIADALGELEMAISRDGARRAVVLNAAFQDINAKATALLKGPTKAAECMAFEQALAALRDAMETYANGAGQIESLTSARLVTELLRHLLEAEAEGSPAAIAQAVVDLRTGTRTSGSFGKNFAPEAGERAARSAKPLLEAIATTNAALDEAIFARKPAPELVAAFSRFEDAAEGFVPRDESGTPGRYPKASVPFYREVIQLYKAAEQGDAAEVANRLQQASGALSSFDRARAERFRALFLTLGTENGERVEKAYREHWTRLQSRLTTAAKPADLDAIALEVASWAREPRPPGTSDGGDSWSQLSIEFAALAAAWASPSAGETMADALRQTPARHPSLAAPLRALRQRIERDSLSHLLRVPEILQPPLQSLETDAALDALADDLVAKSDWRRLHRLLTSRATLQPARARPAEDDSIPALRAFFAAQNLELAEQWAAAASAYKEVLLASSPRAPIAAAAEKLKALAKAHPEINARPVAEPARGKGTPGAVPSRPLKR